MKIQLYTSQSLHYFNTLGKYSIASMLRNLDKNVEIILTTEDYNSFPRLNDRIKVVDLYSLDNGFKEFESRWTGNTMSKVINFAKKGYTVLHACENSNADIMIWLDADAYFKKSFGYPIMHSLLQNNLAAHLGVTHEDGEFTIESGVFLVNLTHPGIKQFAHHYRKYYDNDLCQNMGRFYDSNVQGHTVKDCQAEGITFTEMNLRQKGNTPLKGSMISEYVGHFKGKKSKANNAPEEYARLDLTQELKELTNEL